MAVLLTLYKTKLLYLKCKPLESKKLVDNKIWDFTVNSLKIDNLEAFIFEIPVLTPTVV